MSRVYTHECPVRKRVRATAALSRRRSTSDGFGDCGGSGFLRPAPVTVLLPVGERVALALQALPVRARRLHLVLVVTVEHEDDALIGIERRRLGAGDQETHGGGVRIVGRGRQQHGLIGREGLLVRAVRQETVFAEGPQMGVERVVFRNRGEVVTMTPSELLPESFEL